MDDRYTNNLDLEQMAQLWKLGAGNPAPESDRAVAEILQIRLEEKIGGDPAFWDSLSNVLDHLQRSLDRLAGKSTREILLDPRADLEAIQLVKEQAKRRSQARTTEGEHSAQVTLYYAALASALVHHHHKLTSHSYDYLKKAYENLMGQEWLSADLMNLFSKAEKICEEKMK